jgi:hypothetical protein
MTTIRCTLSEDAMNDSVSLDELGHATDRRVRVQLATVRVVMDEVERSLLASDQALVSCTIEQLSQELGELATSLRRSEER